MDEKIGSNNNPVVEYIKDNPVDAAALAVGIPLPAAKQVYKTIQKNVLNPFFPGDFIKPDYVLPKLIVISSEKENNRYKIDVCKGAIGWTSNGKDMDILHLYETAVSDSGLIFLPNVEYGGVYYPDKFDKTKYINLDSIFELNQQARLAELANIAYSLGAKEYNIELYEETNTDSEFEEKVKEDAGIKKVKATADESFSQNSEHKSVAKSIASAVFSSAREPVYPTLLWFQNDENMKELIKQVVSNGMTSEEHVIKLSGSTYSSMSIQAAAKIEASLKGIGVNSSSNLKRKAIEESSHDMIFHIKF